MRKGITAARFGCWQIAASNKPKQSVVGGSASVTSSASKPKVKLSPECTAQRDTLSGSLSRHLHSGRPSWPKTVLASNPTLRNARRESATGLARAGFSGATLGPRSFGLPLTAIHCRNVRRFRMACSTFCAIRRGHSLSRLRIAWTDTPWSRARRSCSLADSSAGLAKPNSSTSFG